MEVVSTLNLVSSETKKKAACHFETLILLLSHIIDENPNEKPWKPEIIICSFMMAELWKNVAWNTYKQNSKIKTNHQWVERKNLFYFENALSFTIFWSEQKKVDKVFLVKQQTNLWKIW